MTKLLYDSINSKKIRKIHYLSNYYRIYDEKVFKNTQIYKIAQNK